MSRSSFPLFAFIYLLCGGMAIGFAGVFMRLSDVGPFASAFWRMALAAPVLWFWAWQIRAKDQAQNLRLEFTLALGLAGLYFAGDMAIWHLSLQYTTVSNATLLSNFAPLFITLWMWLAYRVSFARLFLVGMGIALTGAALLVTASNNDIVRENKFLGDVLGLASAVFYAGYQLVIKEARNQYSTVRLMAWSTSITALALLPFAIFSSAPFMPAQAVGWLPLIGLALVAQIGGQTVIAYASAHLSAAISSISLLIQPLTATIAAWIIFHESIGPLQMLGAILLLTGIYLSKRSS